MHPVDTITRRSNDRVPQLRIVSNAVKERQLQIWSAGDFSMVAVGSTIVGERLCESVDLRAGQRVLDVATGSGNTALAAARRQCRVAAIDFVPSLLARGRERAAAERLVIGFSEADAEALPFASASFDAVLSTFGVMFAPDQARAARELLRVCRSGGKIGLATWPTAGFVADLQRATAPYASPPAGMASPLLWGDEARLRQLFGDGIESLTVTRQTLVMRATSVGDWLAFSRAYFGPVRLMLESLDEEARENALHEIEEVVARHNRSGDATMAVPAEYLEIVAVRR